MDEIKHTPGPWTINPKDAKPIIGLDVGDGEGLIPIVSSVHGADDEMIEANIQLIAAAPETAFERDVLKASNSKLLAENERLKEENTKIWNSFLELSQFRPATTAKELALDRELQHTKEACRSWVEVNNKLEARVDFLKSQNLEFIDSLHPEDRLLPRAAEADIFQLVTHELARARVKFPKQDVFVALAALTEEVGELNQAVLHRRFEPHKGTIDEDIRKEAVQVITVTLRVLFDSGLFDEHEKGA
jgi:NTP pyrophosphatase (non-canonical NTP hydrolase)